MPDTDDAEYLRTIGRNAIALTERALLDRELPRGPGSEVLCVGLAQNIAGDLLNAGVESVWGIHVPHGHLSIAQYLEHIARVGNYDVTGSELNEFMRVLEEGAFKLEGVKPTGHPNAPGERPADPFPVSSFPPSLREMVEEGAAAQGVDAAYFAVPLLGIVAGCVGATRRVGLKPGWSEPAVLWPANVAMSGSGKSPPLRVLLKPVRDRDYRLHECTQAAQAKYEIARASKGKDEPDPPRPPMLAVVVEDVTYEALGMRLADNPRGLLLTVDELAGWLRGFDRYRKNGGDLQGWLQIHNGDGIKVDRKSATNGPPRVYVRHAAVSVVGTIQPGIARRLLANAAFRESGMVARLLLAAPPVAAVAWTDRCIPESTLACYARTIHSLLDLPLGGDGEALILQLTAEARAEFIAFYNENGAAFETAAKAGDEDTAASLSKLRGAAARIALVLELARAAESGAAVLQTMVGVESMRAGIAIARWFEDQAQRIYEQWGDVDAIERAGREHGALPTLAKRLDGLIGNDEKSLDELHKLTGKNWPATQLRAALAILKAAGTHDCETSRRPAGWTTRRSLAEGFLVTFTLERGNGETGIPRAPRSCRRLCQTGKCGFPVRSGWDSPSGKHGFLARRRSCNYSPTGGFGVSSFPRFLRWAVKCIAGGSLRLERHRGRFEHGAHRGGDHG